MIEKHANSLPAAYSAAERLATDMLVAATRGDWPAVASLRESVPGLAQELESQWTAIRAQDPKHAPRLEKDRVGAIMRILAIDDQIRKLSDSSQGRLDSWLRGSRAAGTVY